MTMGIRRMLLLLHHIVQLIGAGGHLLAVLFEFARQQIFERVIGFRDGILAVRIVASVAAGRIRRQSGHIFGQSGRRPRNGASE